MRFNHKVNVNQIKFKEKKNREVLKEITFREKFRKQNLTFDCGWTCTDQNFKILDSCWFMALYWSQVKFHIHAYFSENFKYFQKALILQAVQCYSRITAKYELIWLMRGWWNSSLKRWHIWPRLCPPRSVILLWIKIWQQIYRIAYII